LFTAARPPGTAGRVAGLLPAIRTLLCAALALLFLGGVPAASLVPPVAPPSPAETAAAPAISAARTDGEDARIAERIRGIFAEVPSLADVTATAQEGVVTLRGTVADAEARTRAEAIAARVQGVVTVENLIERDVSVDTGLGLGDLSDRIVGWARMLPLVGAAVVVALVIAGIGTLLASLTGIWHRLAPNSFLAELIASAIRFISVVAGLVVALDMIGAGTLLGAVLGGAGVVGVALGFAMRDTIENYVASLMLSLRQPFRANDWVVIDTFEGRVIRLTSRATILMTLDGNHLRIPNSTVFKAVILNYTRNPQRRFEFDLGIDAADDPTAARRLGVEVLVGLDFVLAQPEAQARVVEVGDSNIVIRFLGWIDQRETDWYKARSRAIPAVKQALEEAGFALPEPIYRLRFDNSAPALPAQGLAAAPRPRSRPAAKRPPGAIGDGEQDTAPASEVTQMVEQERATTGEKDLLDPSRPIE